MVHIHLKTKFYVAAINHTFYQHLVEIGMELLQTIRNCMGVAHIEKIRMGEKETRETKGTKGRLFV